MQHPTRTAPLCRDCRHVAKPGPVCNHPAAPVDPVDGQPLLLALAMRGHPGSMPQVQAHSRGNSMQLCGSEGRLFDPAPPPAGSTAALALVAAASHPLAPALATGAEC